MNCSKCNSEDVETLNESCSHFGVSTVRTIIKCNSCENKEIIKEVDASNEKLIWFQKENK